MIIFCAEVSYFCCSVKPKRSYNFLTAGTIEFASVKRYRSHRSGHLGLAHTSGFFAAAMKQPQRPSISWLCSRTVKETLRSHIFLTICQCVRYGFCRVGCCVRCSAKNRGKEKKVVVGTSTCKSKTTERAVPQIV